MKNAHSLHTIRPHCLVSLVLVLSTFAVFSQVGKFEFVDYDDIMYVVENHVVKAGLSGSRLLWAFQATYAANWHPITWISHMPDVQVYGLNPGSHHLSNLIFHILNSVFLFHVFRKMTGSLAKSRMPAEHKAVFPECF